jgi:SnoaL-like polyketide cyclase
MSRGAALVAELLDALNRREWARVAASYTPGARVRPDGWHEEVDVPTWHAAFARIVTSFPDLVLAAQHVAVGDGAVIAELRLTGTNRGPFHLGDLDRLVLGTDAERLPPTGRSVDITGTVVLRTSGDLITSERHYWRLLDTLTQLGLVDADLLAHT